MLVGAGEVTVKAALELTRAQRVVVLAGGDAGEDIVELRAIGAADGKNVVGCLHASFEFEGAGARVEKLGQKVDRAVVTRAEGAFATRCGNDVAAWIDYFVGKATRLCTHAAVGRAAGAGKARELAEPGVAKADCAMTKDLEVDIDARDLVNLFERELAGERHAVGTSLAAPGGTAFVVDIRLGGNMGLKLWH